LGEWKIEYPCLIYDLRILLLIIHYSCRVLQFIVKFSPEILVERKDVSFLDTVNIKIQNLQIDLLFLSFLFLLLLLWRSCSMIVNFFFQFHRLQIQHLKHLSRNCLTLHLFRHRIICSLRDYCDSVSMQTAIKPALDDLAILKWIFFENLIYVFLRCLHTQIFEVSGGILLLKNLEEGRIFDIQFLIEEKVTSELGPIFIWKTWFYATFRLSRTLIIIKLIMESRQA
jgi:hypothetical protein